MVEGNYIFFHGRHLVVGGVCGGKECDGVECSKWLGV